MPTVLTHPAVIDITHQSTSSTTSSIDARLRWVLMQLTPEVYDLLDKIFVVDSSKRINLAQIKAHPWYNQPLEAKHAAALRILEDEQGKLLPLFNMNKVDKASTPNQGVFILLFLGPRPTHYIFAICDCPLYHLPCLVPALVMVDAAGSPAQTIGKDGRCVRDNPRDSPSPIPTWGTGPRKAIHHAC